MAPTRTSDTRPKTIIVLEALNAGVPIELDGYRLTAQDDGEVRIRTTSVRYENGHATVNAEAPPPFEISLDGFIRACEALPDHEITRIAANTALAKHRKAQTKRR